MNTYERLQQLRDEIQQMSASPAQILRALDELIHILLIDQNLK